MTASDRATIDRATIDWATIDWATIANPATSPGWRLSQSGHWNIDRPDPR